MKAKFEPRDTEAQCLRHFSIERNKEKIFKEDNRPADHQNGNNQQLDQMLISYGDCITEKKTSWSAAARNTRFIMSSKP